MLIMVETQTTITQLVDMLLSLVVVL